QARTGAVPARTLGVRLRPPRVASRFGVPLESREVFAELIALVQTLPSGFSFGCHFHVASNVFGVEPWWQLYESVLRWGKSIESSSGTPVEILDIGGGWFPNDFDDELARRLTDAVARAVTTLPSLKTFVFEPGRALVQPAMAVVTRLLEVRRSTSGV